MPLRVETARGALPPSQVTDVSGPRVEVGKVANQQRGYAAARGNA